MDKTTITIPVNNITTETVHVETAKIKSIFPQIPSDCDVWIIKISWTPMGVTRMSESTKRMLQNDIDKAIEIAIMDIPKGSLVLHEWPVEGIVESEVDLAIALHKSQLKV